ncbi:uncharacterized protein LOC111244314 isoform X2 [Varroa destructor]|uniref:Uncharacterized protein n=1 Tax=Varroa destructor TaxID=109461 RepID=A0A7M7JJ04_VARDE|nr:uncharacterized protein LOC111244314 isoform X2 [Varroa destructor]
MRCVKHWRCRELKDFSEGLSSIFLRNTFEPPLIVTLAGVLITCGGCSLVFFVEDLLLGLTAASTMYGVGVGLTRALTTNFERGAVAEELHFNREVGSILGGFVGAPLLFVLDDLLLTKGALLVIGGLSLHSIVVVIVQHRAQCPVFNEPQLTSSPETITAGVTEDAKSHYSELKNDKAAKPLIDKAIELERIEKRLPLALAIDGKIPFTVQRKHQSQDLGYRHRVNSFAERELHSVSHHVLERPARRRLNTEPANAADQNFNIIQKIIRAPERSVSADVLHNPYSSPRILQTATMRRSVSQLSLTVLTPIAQLVPLHVAICQVLRTGAFALLLLSFISNVHLLVISTTLLDAYMDKATPKGTHFIRDGIDPICVFLVFTLAKLVGILVTDKLLRNYDASEKTIVLLANFVGGFNLLTTQFVNRLVVVAAWAALFGLVQSALHYLQPNLIRTYMETRIEHYARAMAQIICGFYIAFALPIFVHLYRDLEYPGWEPSYDLLYQIFGLVQLGVSYNWLFLEPFLNKPSLSNEEIGEDVPATDNDSSLKADNV